MTQVETVGALLIIAHPSFPKRSMRIPFSSKLSSCRSALILLILYKLKYESVSRELPIYIQNGYNLKSIKKIDIISRFEK